MKSAAEKYIVIGKNYQNLWDVLRNSISTPPKRVLIYIANQGGTQIFIALS